MQAAYMLERINHKVSWQSLST